MLGIGVPLTLSIGQVGLQPLGQDLARNDPDHRGRRASRRGAKGLRRDRLKVHGISPGRRRLLPSGEGIGSHSAAAAEDAMDGAILKIVEQQEVSQKSGRDQSRSTSPKPRAADQLAVR